MLKATHFDHRLSHVATFFAMATFVIGSVLHAPVADAYFVRFFGDDNEGMPPSTPTPTTTPTATPTTPSPATTQAPQHNAQNAAFLGQPCSVTVEPSDEYGAKSGDKMPPFIGFVSAVIIMSDGSLSGKQQGAAAHKHHQGGGAQRSMAYCCVVEPDGLAFIPDQSKNGRCTIVNLNQTADASEPRQVAVCKFTGMPSNEALTTSTQAPTTPSPAASTPATSQAKCVVHIRAEDENGKPKTFNYTGVSFTDKNGRQVCNVEDTKDGNPPSAFRNGEMPNFCFVRPSRPMQNGGREEENGEQLEQDQPLENCSIKFMKDSKKKLVCRVILFDRGIKNETKTLTYTGVWQSKQNGDKYDGCQLEPKKGEDPQAVKSVFEKGANNTCTFTDLSKQQPQQQQPPQQNPDQSPNEQSPEKLIVEACDVQKDDSLSEDDDEPTTPHPSTTPAAVPPMGVPCSVETCGAGDVCTEQMKMRFFGFMSPDGQHCVVDMAGNKGAAFRTNPANEHTCIYTPPGMIDAESKNGVVMSNCTVKQGNIEMPGKQTPPSPTPNEKSGEDNQIYPCVVFVQNDDGKKVHMLGKSPKCKSHCAVHSSKHAKLSGCYKVIDGKCMQATDSPCTDYQPVPAKCRMSVLDPLTE